MFGEPIQRFLFIPYAQGVYQLAAANWPDYRLAGALAGFVLRSLCCCSVADQYAGHNGQPARQSFRHRIIGRRGRSGRHLVDFSLSRKVVSSAYAPTQIRYVAGRKKCCSLVLFVLAIPFMLPTRN